MSALSEGPPEMEEAAPARTAPRHARQDDDTDTSARADRKPGASLVRVACSRPHALQDHVSRDRRRRDAEYRSLPLDCGCRDPWPCRCTEPPLTERWVDAGRDAALHILERGEVPRLELEVLRALYRRGGEDRALAELLHHAGGGAAQ